MKIKCIVIPVDKKIPILDEITLTEDNYIYVNTTTYPWSDLEIMEISKDNKKLNLTHLDNKIYAVSSNQAVFTYYDAPEYKNIEINDIQLWGDVVILKIINDKVYDLTPDEIDYYIQKINKAMM